MPEIFAFYKPGFTDLELMEECNRMIAIKGFILNDEKYHNQLPRSFVELLYDEHKEKPWFKDNVDYIISGSVVVQRWWHEDFHYRDIGELFNSVLRGTEGTIRGRFSKDYRRNVMHASDSNFSAQRELLLAEDFQLFSQ